MRYLAGILTQHFKKDTDYLSILFVFLIGLGLTVIQYQFHVIREPIVALPNLVRIPCYWLLQMLLFTSALGILHYRNQLLPGWNTPSFWIVLSGVLLITASDQSYWLLYLIRNLPFANEFVQSAVVSVATRAVSLVTVIIPVMLVFRIRKPQDVPAYYGLRFSKNLNLAPYFLILGIMAVLISISTLSSGISHYYPIYKRMGIYVYAQQIGLSPALSTAIFELVYASDFISVELFFRGFALYTLSKYLGKQTVLPLALCYMIFHFGKPMVETISSFFGGYLLGVFALHTRNIWGGVILHIGTALFMEIIAHFL